MRKTTEQFWNAIARGCQESYSAKYLPLCLMMGLKDKYLKQCDDQYNNYKAKFMKSEVKNLDRHKVAAILVVEGIALNIIHCDNIPKDQIFIGQEKILLTYAFRYIMRDFNSIIRNSGFERMKQFVLPEAFSCETKYIDIMCRNLMYTRETGILADPKMALNVEMELAEKLFLLEYIAISAIYQDKAGEVYNFLRQTIVGT